MLCTYEITVRAICPIHLVDDVYEVTVESRSTIYVERLLAFAKTLESTKQTQEDITVTLARKFPGTTIRSVGYHSGVKATVVAP